MRLVPLTHNAPTDQSPYVLSESGQVPVIQARAFSSVKVLAVLGILLLPLLLVTSFLFLVSLEPSTSAEPAVALGIEASRYLAYIATQPLLYCFLALIFGGVAAWRFLLGTIDRDPAVEDCVDPDRSSIAVRVARNQRQRAFRLRTVATFLLMTVVLLLASGLYLILFVLPVLVEGYDVGIRVQAQFAERYGRPLDLLSEGRYWVSIRRELNPPDSSDPLQGQSLTFSPDGQLGLAVPGRRAGEVKRILSTMNGGRTWTPRSGLEFPPGHSFGTAQFSVGGRNALALSSKGAAIRTTNGGDSWEIASSVENLREEDWISTRGIGLNETQFMSWVTAARLSPPPLGALSGLLPRWRESITK